MILPRLLETILYWVGGCTLFLLVCCLPLSAFEKVHRWNEKHWKASITFICVLTLIALITFPLGMISIQNRQQAVEEEELKELQKQCVEYHEATPVNWNICPICGEEFNNG